MMEGVPDDGDAVTCDLDVVHAMEDRLHGIGTVVDIPRGDLGRPFGIVLHSSDELHLPIHHPVDAIGLGELHPVQDALRIKGHTEGLADQAGRLISGNDLDLGSHRGVKANQREEKKGGSIHGSTHRSKVAG